MPGLQFNEDIDVIGMLRDRQRRSLYTYVSRRRHQVSRDEAAQALSISRSLAAFHLDRLVETGLLEVSYRRLTGRQGPGAGRPSKLYRRSNRQIVLSLPQRRYDLLAQLFAGPLDEARDPRVKGRLAQAARRFGQALTSTYRARRGPTTRGSFRVLSDFLDRLGAEPYEEGRVVRLRNCPFEAVASTYPKLVCDTNLNLVRGLLVGLGLDPLGAELDPEQGRCCVAVTRSSMEGGRHAQLALRHPKPGRQDQGSPVADHAANKLRANHG
jgi:predicted ArsR family transcriptional regulator